MVFNVTWRKRHCHYTTVAWSFYCFKRWGHCLWRYWWKKICINQSSPVKAWSPIYLYRYWFFRYSYLLMVQRSSLAPYLREFGNPSSRKYLVVTWLSVWYLHVWYLLCACATFSRSFILPLLAYNWKKKHQTVFKRNRWETWSGESCNLT